MNEVSQHEREERLLVEVSRLDSAGEELTGEVWAVDLKEPFVRPFGGVRYRLWAQVLGSELLVRGHLEQDFDLTCCRCGHDFDTTVSLDDFLCSIEVTADSDAIDLTEEIRESVILALPNYPLCREDCPGLETAQTLPEDTRWGVLDGLKME